ncbi:MAG TPA: hypothetical protein PKC39_13745 [Ferruginibacter sp.]|nr:hypothetical protein [Ferruginibacter sp.]HMP22019.1 hypothetical protein [Ferruginibacter sp.]
MKKVTTLLLAALLLNVCIAVNPSAEGIRPLKATEIMLPIGSTGNSISLADFSQLKPAEYEKLANVKLNFFDRIAYKRAMKKLRNSISADGTVTNHKISKVLGGAALDSGDGFHIGGAALGFLLGLIGVLIAYLINDDKKSSRVKWAWIGLGAAVVLALLFLI